MIYSVLFIGPNGFVHYNLRALTPKDISYNEQFLLDDHFTLVRGRKLASTTLNDWISFTLVFNPSYTRQSIRTQTTARVHACQEVQIGLRIHCQNEQLC